MQQSLVEADPQESSNSGKSQIGRNVPAGTLWKIRLAKETVLAFTGDTVTCLPLLT